MIKKIAVLAGDGIGTEIMASALQVLSVVEKKSGTSFEVIEGLVGGAAYDQFGCHLPQRTLNLCESAHAILFGSVGGPVSQQHVDKWRNCEANSILALRKHFGFFLNVRPIQVYKDLAHLSPVRMSDKNVNILFVRELLGDLYFGEHVRQEVQGVRSAKDTAIYDERQIRNIAIKAFSFAQKRSRRLHSVDKANVLSISQLWREVVNEVSSDFPDVNLQHILVDNCAMQLVKDPSSFDVLLCPNMFGDILSDLGSVFPGSLGLCPSASLSNTGKGLYEPSGGAAPDIAGMNIANPTGMILSLALMLRHSFQMHDQANGIESAIERCFQDGLGTRDLQTATPLATSEFTEQFIQRL